MEDRTIECTESVSAKYGYDSYIYGLICAWLLGYALLDMGNAIIWLSNTITGTGKGCTDVIIQYGLNCSNNL